MKQEISIDIHVQSKRSDLQCRDAILIPCMGGERFKKNSVQTTSDLQGRQRKQSSTYMDAMQRQ